MHYFVVTIPLFTTLTTLQHIRLRKWPDGWDCGKLTRKREKWRAGKGVETPRLKSAVCSGLYKACSPLPSL